MSRNELDYISHLELIPYVQIHLFTQIERQIFRSEMVLFPGLCFCLAINVRYLLFVEDALDSIKVSNNKNKAITLHPFFVFGY